MSYLACLCSRNYSSLGLLERGVSIWSDYSVTRACSALWSEAMAEFVTAHDLDLLAGAMAPAECYPYPGKLPECKEGWCAPLEVSASAARYAEALRRLTPGERDALRQGLYDWEDGDEPLLTDAALDAMLRDLIWAMEDLSLQARHIADLGEDLMLIALA